MCCVFYLGGVREGEVFRTIRVAVEEVGHVVVGQPFQLCLANISQEIHGELHPCTSDRSEREQCSDPQLLLSSLHQATVTLESCGTVKNELIQ